MMDVISPRIVLLTSVLARAQRKLRHSLWQEPSMVEHKERFYRQAWVAAAAALGANVKDLGDNILEIRLGNKRTRVRQNYCALDDPVTLAVAGNKPLVHRLLIEANLPVPRHTEFTLNSIVTAAAFLDRVGAACVVKPAKNTGAGAGITTWITGRRQLTAAALKAAEYGRDLMIEEQVDGDNYRLLYLDGRLIDTVVRRPPAVTGDGSSTVAELLVRANRERLENGFERAQSLLSIDEDMKNTLLEQGLTLRSVPEAGCSVVLKRVINDNAGMENEPADHLPCAAIVDAGARAVKTVGARLAGVDIVTSAPSRPLAETGGCILEVNTTPGFYIHYKKRGGAFPVAEKVLATLLLDEKRQKQTMARPLREQASRSLSSLTALS